MVGRRLAIEAVAVAAFAAISWAVIYSPFITSCCGVFDAPVFVLLWSASVVGAAFTGAGSAAGRGEVLIGLIVEALAIWAIVRGVAHIFRKRGSDDL